MGAREELTFDPASHTYRFLGAVVPSVTQVLAPLVDFSRVPPDVLEAKRELGTMVHEACHYWDEDDLDIDCIPAAVEPYLTAWQKFKAETRAEVLLCERRVFDPMLMYAGTLDRVLLIDGIKWLVDLKTSFSTPASAGPQTAAYTRALGDLSVTRRAALRLRDDGTYRFDPLNGADDWAVFAACLTVRRFMEKQA